MTTMLSTDEYDISPAELHDAVTSETPVLEIDPATMIFEFDRLQDVCMGEVEAERQFIGDLLRLVPRTLARLGQSVACGDVASVHATAHALKGHCLMLGANALGHVLGDLERDASGGSLSRGGALLARAELEHLRVRDVLERYLDA